MGGLGLLNLMARATTASGDSTNTMARERTNNLMVQFTKELLILESKMELEAYVMPMEQYTKAVLRMIKSKDEGRSVGLMVKNIEVIGNEDRCTDKVN
jgi:hypothetical protein